MDLRGTARSFIFQVFTALAAGLIATTGFAGDVLRFHNGDVKLQNKSAFRSGFSNLSDDYVMQFKTAITEKDKADLIAAGMRYFRYIPDDALVVRATAAQIDTFSKSHQVNGFVPYQGSMKLSSAMPALSVFSRIKSLNVAIFTFTAEDRERLLHFLEVNDPDLFIIDNSQKVLSVRMNQALLPLLSEQPGVEFIQELVKLETMNFVMDDSEIVADPNQLKGDYTDLTGFESGTKVMSMDSVWGLGYYGAGQIVAMADTGLDTGVMTTIATDFNGAILKGFAFGIGAKGSWEDPMGHGTHVAGSVLSRGTASNGTIKGAATEAKMIAEGMWSPIISNLTVPPKLVSLFQSAYDEGARIHTNSWGAAKADLFGSYEGMAQQVDQFMWDNPEMLVIFAAGNSGVDMNKDGRIDPTSVGPPGTAKNTLTVGASENYVLKGGIQKQIKDLRDADKVWGAEPIYSSKVSDNTQGIAMFSSRGPTKDTRIKPDIVAPGTNVLSNRSHHPNAELLWGEYNKDYVFSGGTSMATPLTAGAAAITREMLVKKFHIATPSAALLKATMMHTALDLYPGQYGEGVVGQELATRRPNSDEGYGRVDMDKMSKVSLATKFIESEVEQAKEYRTTVKVTKGNLLVNLVYTDAPGTPSAAAALVNDLDLQVVAGANLPVLGAEANPSDRINNSEIVELAKLAPGSYDVVVKGAKIPMGKNGKQPFALVITAN